MEGYGGIGDRRTQVLAHRGYRVGGVSENSLAAFEAGHALGVDQLELDVRRTRDGELVIYHDPKLEDGRRLADVDYRDLPLLPDGQRIPTLTQVARFARTSGSRLAVELKEQGYEREVAFTLASNVPMSQVELISFNRDSIRELEAFDPSIRTGLLEPRLPEWLRSSPFYGAARWFMDTFNWHPSLSAAAKAGADYVSVEHRMVDDEFVADARRRGLDVMAWTVDDPARMRELLALGVDGIVTDRPDLALAARDQTTNGAKLLAA